MSFWLNKISFQNILVNSLGSLIAWIAWSIIILIISFFLSDSVAISSTFAEARIWLKASPIFPLILSIITLIWTTITMFLTYYILNLTDSEKYKKNIVILWQITFFTFITYLFITPMYIYIWMQSYDNIMIVYLFHVIILTFWTHIILEALNNYRNILIWIYWSFVGLFLSTIITIIIFSSFTSWFAKLISLLVLLPIINFTITFFKQLFELMYFYYNKYSNQDPLWDIFYQIEMEEKELLKLEEEKNSI